jgi:acyl-CoA synthetase (NDP forming)
MGWMDRMMRPTLLQQIEHIFDPQSVAVIGASNEPAKWGFNVFSRVLASAQAREVYPVNNSAEHVLGARAYPTIRDIPGPVELAVVVVPMEGVPSVMEDCLAKGVKAAVVITAGFEEVGEEGKAAQEQIVAMARRGGLRFVGPNCMGHFSTASNLFTTGDPRTIRTGPVACVSQSGNFAGYILSRGSEMGVGFSKFVSTGNEADLHLEDYLEYLAQDDHTRVITAYIEGLREPRRFFLLAREVTRRKPIVVMKVGRTSEGARAALSHTAALAGEDAIYDAAFRQCGVIRVEEVEEMFDVAAALIHQPRPRGRRVGILTGGGGFGVVATDACVRLRLEVPSLSAETVDTINKYLPPRWSHANPVDMAGTAVASYACLGTLLKAENVDAVLGISCVGYPAGPPPDEASTPAGRRLAELSHQIAQAEEGLVDGLIERMWRHNKPVILAASPGTSLSPAVAKLEANGVFVYPTPERAARVLSHLVRYGEYLASVDDLRG